MFLVCLRLFFQVEKHGWKQSDVSWRFILLTDTCEGSLRMPWELCLLVNCPESADRSPSLGGERGADGLALNARNLGSHESSQGSPACVSLCTWLLTAWGQATLLPWESKFCCQHFLRENSFLFQVEREKFLWKRKVSMEETCLCVFIAKTWKSH